MRFTEVLHVHVGGQVIRTTGEHPFFVYNRGWVAVAQLTAGDYLLTDAGEWRQVEEVFPTGQFEVVYNLRVADWHTYFVGDETWGWAGWAHNACITFEQHQIAAGSGTIDTYVRPASKERERWAKRPASLGGGKWKDGKGNIAMLTYEINGASATGTPYGSGDKDAEVNALNVSCFSRNWTFVRWSLTTT